MIPGSVATALIDPAAGKIYDKIGIKKLYIVGAASLFASNAGMYFVTLSTPLAAAAVFNVLRNVSIGCLMMPLPTWGTSNVASEKVADASSLLTSLRTVACSVGSAVFVSVMTYAAANTTRHAGEV